MSTTLNVNIEGVTRRIEDGQHIFRVDTPNALTQLAGYLRFAHADGLVAYRGQTHIHSDMLPTGLRGTTPKARLALQRDLSRFVDQLMGSPCLCGSGAFSYKDSHLCTERKPARRGKQNVPIVKGTYRAVIEPLLQHYGIKTRWLDLVDNVWVALWFACHSQHQVRRYAHHERRSPAQEEESAKSTTTRRIDKWRSDVLERLNHVSDDDLKSELSAVLQDEKVFASLHADQTAYAYIAVMTTGRLYAADRVWPHGDAIPGYYLSARTRIVDLRYCVPSVYLRPHAQHALLMAPVQLADGSDGSLKDVVLAYIEVRLRDALEWLGSGIMSSPFVLFPPPSVDDGYRRLLDYAMDPPSRLGMIMLHSIGRE